jgi:chromosome transmission fidelity protein 1
MQRQALGVELAGNVVVFDEAHNLVDAVADAHTTLLTASQLSLAIEDVCLYTAKYAQLNLDTRTLLVQLSALIMPKLLAAVNACAKDVVLSVEDFLRTAKLEDVNLFPIVAKAKELRLNRRLKAVSKSSSTILAVLGFLNALGQETTGEAPF